MGKPRHSRRRRKSGSSGGGSVKTGEAAGGTAKTPGKRDDPQLFKTLAGGAVSRGMRSWRCRECDWRCVALPSGETGWSLRHTGREAAAVTDLEDTLSLMSLMGIYAHGHRDTCGVELERRG